MHDDIREDTATSATESTGIPKDQGSHRKTVGPESEVRGGPDAADETLDQPDRGTR